MDKKKTIVYGLNIRVFVRLKNINISASKICNGLLIISLTFCAEQ